MLNRDLDLADEVYKEILPALKSFGQNQALPLIGDLVYAKVKRLNTFFDHWYQFFTENIGQVSEEDNAYLCMQIKYYYPTLLKILNNEIYSDGLSYYLKLLRNYINKNSSVDRDVIEQYIILAFIAGDDDSSGLMVNNHFDLLFSERWNENIEKIIKLCVRRIKYSGSLIIGFHYLLLIVYIKNFKFDTNLIIKELELRNI